MAMKKKMDAFKIIIKFNQNHKFSKSIQLQIKVVLIKFSEKSNKN